MQQVTAKKFKMFLTAYLQVSLVALNTIFLVKGYWIALGIVSFSISFIWTYNVSKLAFSSVSDKLLYACGASMGSISGLLLTKLVGIT